MHVQRLPFVLHEAPCERVMHARVVDAEVVLLALRAGAPSVSACEMCISWQAHTLHIHNRSLTYYFNFGWAHTDDHVT